MKVPKYALYRGDKLVEVGTLYQLAELLGCSYSTVRWYTSPACRRRAEGQPARLYAIRLEDDE